MQIRAGHSRGGEGGVWPAGSRSREAWLPPPSPSRYSVESTAISTGQTRVRAVGTTKDVVCLPHFLLQVRRSSFLATRVP